MANTSWNASAETTDIPVIVFSGQMGKEVEGKMRRIGADSFLHKPLHYQDLIDEISKYVTLVETE